MPGERHLFCAYGLTVASSVALPFVPAATNSQYEGNVSIEIAATEAVERRFSGASGPPRYLPADGGTVRAEHRLGREGDALITYAGAAKFHVAGDGTSVICAAPRSVDRNAWRRFLLDTVLGTAALAHGIVGLHAAAVATPAGVVAVSALTGGGKSSLCAELIARGASLFSDDLLFISRAGGRITAYPGPPVMTLPLDQRARAAIGRRLAVLGGEEWIAVSRAAREPAELAMLVFLDRRAGIRGARLEVEDSPVALMAAALSTGLQPDRVRREFELLGDLQATVPMQRLLAPPELAPAALADKLEVAIPK